MASHSSKDETAVSATCASHSITTQAFHLLRHTAVNAKSTAYCPYSKFRVGAALLLPDDAVVPGVNVENASYPVGTCAERVAIATAVAGGVAKGFKAIAVSTDISPPASPCGMCRQFIREFCAMEMPVIMFDKNEDYVVMTVEQLLPMSFGPDRLPPPGSLGV